ncbi:hypothetical protein BT69DRAFT_1338008 [Atractiella rhizophila]|nr:hypothetical protein BT69DRAFT_1338008 [Atractiella rhizophila]
MSTSNEYMSGGGGYGSSSVSSRGGGGGGGGGKYEESYDSEPGGGAGGSMNGNVMSPSSSNARHSMSYDEHGSPRSPVGGNRQSFAPPPPNKDAGRPTVPPIAKIGPIATTPEGLLNVFMDMERVVQLHSGRKFYVEGWIFRRIELDPGGKQTKPMDPNSQWDKFFAQLAGTTLSVWNSREMEDAAKRGQTVPPTYINLHDSFVLPVPPSQSTMAQPPPAPYVFALNSAGHNKMLFAVQDLPSLRQWVNGIRLAIWERGRTGEIYTGALVGKIGEKGLPGDGWKSPLAPGKGRLEGPLRARLPGETSWRSVWGVVSSGSSSGSTTADGKKSRRASILSFKGRMDGGAGHSPFAEDVPMINFYESKRDSKKGMPIQTLTNLFYCAAVFPESPKLIDSATLFKIEGTFPPLGRGKSADGHTRPDGDDILPKGVGGRGESQGYALLMPEDGGTLDMMRWILAILDAFKLFGRPAGFAFDPRDPSGFFFGYPLQTPEMLFLSRDLADPLELGLYRPKDIRDSFHHILFERMRGPISAMPLSAASEMPPHPALGRAPVLPPIGEGTSPEDNGRMSFDHANGAGVRRSESNTSSYLSPRNNAAQLRDRDIGDRMDKMSLNDRTKSSTSTRTSQSPPPANSNHNRMSSRDPEEKSIALRISNEFSKNNSRSSSPGTTKTNAASFYAPGVTEQYKLAAQKEKEVRPTDIVSVQPQRIITTPSVENNDLGEDVMAALNFMERAAQVSRGPSPNAKVLSTSPTSMSTFNTSRDTAAKPSAPVSASMSPSASYNEMPKKPESSYSKNAAPDTDDDDEDISRFEDKGESNHRREVSAAPSTTFGRNKAAERMAAQQAAQAGRKENISRPGRAMKAAGKGRRIADDSDEDEEDEEDHDKDTEEDHGTTGGSMDPVRPLPVMPRKQSRNLPVPPSHLQAHEGSMSAGNYRRSTPQGPGGPGALRHRAHEDFEAGHSPSPSYGGQDGQNEKKMQNAFSPHGLLASGVQAKEERSAKMKETLARETGGTLIDVPSKPPPPQTGLLGAITAHEQHSNRPGGVGAALTEKERDRKKAEMQQREMDQMQQQMMGGPGMFPFQQGFYGMNPMMGGMGYPMAPFGFGMPGMQGNVDPQAAMQQQQAMMAAQTAYFQAMMMQSGGMPTGMSSMPGMPMPSAPSQMGMFPMGQFPMGTPMGGFPGMPPQSGYMTPMATGMQQQMPLGGMNTNFGTSPVTAPRPLPQEGGGHSPPSPQNHDG